jgi:hypothetical protein
VIGEIKARIEKGSRSAGVGRKVSILSDPFPWTAGHGSALYRFEHR